MLLKLQKLLKSSEHQIIDVFTYILQLKSVDCLITRIWSFYRLSWIQANLLEPEVSAGLQKIYPGYLGRDCSEDNTMWRIDKRKGKS
jgi:hypothetical protein